MVLSNNARESGQEQLRWFIESLHYVMAVIALRFFDALCGGRKKVCRYATDSHRFDGHARPKAARKSTPPWEIVFFSPPSDIAKAFALTSDTAIIADKRHDCDAFAQLLVEVPQGAKRL